MRDFFKLRESMTDFTNRDYKPGATEQEKRNAIKRKRADVEEGTWHLPSDKKVAAMFKKAMMKPIILGNEGDDAIEVIGAFIGDDELYDDIYVAGKKKPKGDARPVIKKAMKRLGIDPKTYFWAGSKESVEEKKKETPDEWMKRTGKKPTKVKPGTGKAGKTAIKKFKKSFGNMKDKEAEVDEGKAYGPTGIAYAVKTGHPDEVDPKTKKKYPERQTPKYKKQWAKTNKESIAEEYPDGYSNTWRDREGMVFDRFDMQEEVKVDEATDIFNKGGIHVTRFAMGKGKLGFQFNFGKIGRYIQVPLEKLSVLDQAIKMAKKAGKSGKQGDLPIADDVNEEGGAGLFGTTALRKKYEDETPGQGQRESTAAYAKSLEKIARDKQLASISDKDKQTLMKIAAMLAKEKKK